MNRISRINESLVNGVLLGTIAMSGSIFILLAYLHRVLDVNQYADFATFWSIAAGLLVGLNAPLETLGLSVSKVDKRIHLKDFLHIERLGFRQTVVLLSVISVLAFLLRNKLPVRYESFLVCLAVVGVGYTLIYGSRGFLLARGLTRQYGFLMAGEGLFRIALCLVFASIWRVTGVTAALAVAAVTLMVGIAHRRQVIHFSELTESPSTLVRHRDLILLTISSICFLGLANAEPVAAYFLGDANWTGSLLNALTIARGPLMFVAVLQALVIPTVIRNRSADRLVSGGLTLRQILIYSSVMVSIFAVLFSMFGNQIIDILYGCCSVIGWHQLLLLSLTPACYVVGVLGQSILVVVQDFKAIAAIWIGGVISFSCGLFLPIEPVMRIIFSGFISGLALVALFVARIAYLLKVKVI